MRYDDMEGKTAVVTGGTRGLGLAVAEKLAQSGARLVVAGRSPEHGEEALARLRGFTPDVRFVRADLADYGAVQNIFQHATDQFGGVDLLVSAGAEGPFGPRPFAEMTADDLQQSFATRFYPRIYPVHAAIPHLSQNGGSVVMITTDAARVPTPGEAIIGAVGASVILLTKALGREFSRLKIRVNSVAMTLTSDTPSWDRIFSKADFETKVFSKALERFPSGRAPTSAEVAGVALFLLSSEASQITGQTISVNGGLSFGGW